VEHDALQGTFLIGALAVVLAVVLFVWWFRCRKLGRQVRVVRLALLICLGVAGVSTAWLVYERHEKCGTGVSRTLCDSPIDWLRSR